MVMRANGRVGLRGRQIARNISINNPVLLTASLEKGGGGGGGGINEGVTA